MKIEEIIAAVAEDLDNVTLLLGQSGGDESFLYRVTASFKDGSVTLRHGMASRDTGAFRTHPELIACGNVFGKLEDAMRESVSTGGHYLAHWRSQK